MDPLQYTCWYLSP